MVYLFLHKSGAKRLVIRAPPVSAHLGPHNMSSAALER